jgi:hypothetical protein
MDKAMPSYSRRKQILSTLRENGSLCTKSLRSLVVPPLPRRNANDVMKRLREQGLVVQRFDSLPANAGHYYQISQSEEALKKIAKILELDPAELNIPKIRDQELAHNDSCAIWTQYLKRILPKAILLREHEFTPELLSHILLITYDDPYEFRPDIMLELPFKVDEKKRVNIAIEVERSRKTDKRLLRKLKKYAMETRVDGVIYICSKPSILDAVKQIYKGRVLENSVRIKHYGNNFLMFVSGIERGQADNVKLLNADLKTVNLRDWLHFLQSTQYAERAEASARLST